MLRYSYNLLTSRLKRTYTAKIIVLSRFETNGVLSDRLKYSLYILRYLLL